MRTVVQAVLVALALALTLSISPAPASLAKAPGAAPKAAEPDPLRVQLASITPSTLTDDDQPLTISGTVTNQSDEPWTTINLYSFRSSAPILDAANLAGSAAIAADAYVGERIVTVGTEDTVDELDPGESEGFTLTVPRELLEITVPGVYWLGIHARGTSSQPRDDVTDGRARTFIPLVLTPEPPQDGGRRGGLQGSEDDKRDDAVDTAIVLPIREDVWVTPDGRVDRVDRWATSLDVGGRLHSLLMAGDPAADDVPLTWLVDPAVLAAVARLGAGNPARSLAPDPEALPVDPTEVPEKPTEGAPAGPGPFAILSDPIPPVDPDQPELTEAEQQLADVANEWLDRFKQAAAGQTVLALPYGDLDVSADAANGSQYYEQAVMRSNQVMGWLGIDSSPAIAPRDGILSQGAISAATEDSTILVGDTSFAVPPDSPTSMVRLLQHKLVVTSTGAAAGGPSPTPFDDPLAIRQRLLSEAALRVLTPPPSPVVVMLPADWHPTDPDALLADLDVPWLSPVTVADIADRPAVSMRASDLAYTQEDVESELDAANFSAGDQLNARADLLASVLTLPTLVRQQVADEVLTSLSSGHRPHSDKVADSVQAATGFLSAQLDEVTVEAPDSVTLSSEKGNLGADLVNGLDQPVTVRLGVRSGGSLELEDLGPIPLDAGARFRILPEVTASRPGIHQVALVVTDIEGEPIGASTDLQIRAAEVSGLIWLLLAGGALLLFGTIAIRLVKRIRGRRAPPSRTSPASP